MSNDAQKIQAIREACPATRCWSFLNVGTFGPLPQPAYEAMQHVARLEWEQGRLCAAVCDEHQSLKDELRDEIADLVGARPEEIALTHHTSEGMNIATLGIDWRAGDEAVTTTVEHSAGLMPLYIARRRFGVRLRFADVGMGSDVVEAIEQAIGPRTRLVSLSHVSFSTGAVLPLQEVVDMAHRRGILVVADGAQAVGAMPVDLDQLGVDFYALPGQKWLCGSAGVGALYVRRDRLAELELTFGGYASTRTYDHTGYFVPRDGARRFEVADFHAPALAGQLASLRWLRQEVGWDWIYSRVARLAEHARQVLQAIEGVSVLTPPNKAGLLHVQVDGIDRPGDLVQGLAERGILIRSINSPVPCVRIAPSFYNTEEEVEALASAIQEIRQQQAA